MWNNSIFYSKKDLETVLAREGKKLPEKSVRAIHREMLEFCVEEN